MIVMPEAPPQAVTLKYRVSTGVNQERKLWREPRRDQRQFIVANNDQVRRGNVAVIIEQLQQVADRWLEDHPDHEAVLVEFAIYAQLGGGHQLRGRLQIFRQRELERHAPGTP